MLEYLTGILAEARPGCAVIECGGVAFKCGISLNTYSKLPERGTAAKLYVKLCVREDAMELYGFGGVEERSCFEMLTGVSGVGPRVAMSVLSETTPEKFAVSVAMNDTKALTRAKGVGAKLAQRIILELRDKLKGDIKTDAESAFALPSAGTTDDAMDALTVLGYSRGQSADALRRIDPSLSLEDTIRQALRLLMK